MLFPALGSDDFVVSVFLSASNKTSSTRGDVNPGCVRGCALSCHCLARDTETQNVWATMIMHCHLGICANVWFSAVDLTNSDTLGASLEST